MTDTATSVNPETEQWLIDRAVENTNGIYPEATEWSPDQEQARADLVGILSDLHAGANISLSDIDGYLVAVIEAAERLRTTIPKTWEDYVGRNDSVRFTLDPASGADEDTWLSFLQRGITEWCVTVTRADGTTVDLLIVDIHHRVPMLDLPEGTDPSPYRPEDRPALVGHPWNEELGDHDAANPVTIPWADIATITIN